MVSSDDAQLLREFALDEGLQKHKHHIGSYFLLFVGTESARFAETLANVNFAHTRG